MSNTHALKSNIRDISARFGDSLLPFISSGGQPAIPSSSLTIDAFATSAYVLDTSNGELIYVSQPSAAIAIADATPTWLMIYKDISSAVADWTRVTGTHYLYRQSATQPATPAGGLIFSKITVAASVISAVTNFAYRSPIDAALNQHDIANWGAVGDGAADDTAAIQAAIDAADATPAPVVLGEGTFNVTGLTIANGITFAGSGMERTILDNQSAVNHIISHTGGGVAADFGLTIKDMSILHSGGGSVVDGIHIVDGHNFLRLERLYVNMAAAGRHAVFLQGNAVANKRILYPFIDHCWLNGAGTDCLHIDGDPNSGVVIGGRISSAGANGIRLTDTVTGTTSFPNNWTFIGIDVASCDVGIKDGGVRNRYIGIRFEGNATRDIELAADHASSGGSMWFGSGWSSAPVILNSASTRPIFIDKTNGLRTFQANGHLEMYDEADGAVRLIPKRGVFTTHIDAHGAGSDKNWVIARVPDDITVTRVSFTPDTGITGVDTDNIRLGIRFSAGSGSGTLFRSETFALGTNATALVEYDLTDKDDGGASADLSQGDIIIFQKTENGTSNAIVMPAMTVQIEYKGR